MLPPDPLTVVGWMLDLDREAARAARRRQREREQRETDDSEGEQDDNVPTGPAQVNGPLN